VVDCYPLIHTGRVPTEPFRAGQAIPGGERDHQGWTHVAGGGEQQRGRRQVQLVAQLREDVVLRRGSWTVRELTCRVDRGQAKPV
jgi:hypothetical protein